MISIKGMVATLKRAGAKLVDRDEKGQTPLMHAASDNGNPEVIATLEEPNLKTAARMG